MESLGGLNDVSEKDEMKEEKVVNLNEEKEAQALLVLDSKRQRLQTETESFYNWQAGEQVSPEYHEPGGRHALPVGHADYYSGGYGALGAWD